MFNVRLGAAATIDRDYLCDYNRGWRRGQFVLGLEAAYAVDGDKRAYLGIDPQFQFQDYCTTINLPLTFQYDIDLPVKGLYIYPKVNAGVSIWVQDYRRYDNVFFDLELAVGLKYQFHPNIHFGADPLGFVFYIGDTFAAQYHFFAYIGFDV
ncbi:MAG: hypothetical protein U0271_02115 [Polyangiaceae bacterium]